MTLSVDLDTKTVVASVGDLSGEESGRILGLGGSGLSRMWLGQELHRRKQDEMTALGGGFRSEVPLERTVEIDGWTLALSGRADGVVFDGAHPCRVDEIKTLHFAVDLHGLYAEERLEPFRHQVKLYAWMLSEDGRPPVEARLILVDIVTGEERIDAVPWVPEAVTAWVRKKIHRLVAAETRRLERLEYLRTVAATIPFPHDGLRPHQEEIGAAVTESLEAEGHLLIQAPTGTGKTAAVLHPALKAALARGKRLFFLTAKTLQQRLAVQTLTAMQGDGRFRSLQLRSKAKMCANAEVVCHEEYCPWAREYGPKLVRSGLLPMLLEGSPHQDPDVVFDVAANHEVCPFEVSLDLLPDIDVVVCDYNYVFDPTIGLKSVLGGRALEESVLVIDEAHNLVDRSREYFSPELAQKMVLDAIDFLGDRDHSVFGDLRRILGDLSDVIADLVGREVEPDREGDCVIELSEEPFGAFRMALDGAVLQYFLYKRENDLWFAEDPVLDVFWALTRFHRVLVLGGGEFVHLARRERTAGASLKIFCCDASRFIGEILQASAGSVAMSATLEPFDFYRDLLGFDPNRTSELALPSPFPPAHRLVINIPEIDTTWRRRAHFHDAVAGWIHRLAPEGRNALVLFPSYEYLRAVSERLAPGGHEVIVQRPGSSDEIQAEVLEALAGDRPHIVLAVLGGIFAEGVDYPGDMLSQVVVVSPGLPQFNTERELLRRYFDEAYDHGFSYAYLVPGMTRVVQAAGRLIRSAEDRGVIVLVGRRFLDGRHARFLPRDWTEDDPTTLVHEDPEFSVRRFFDEVD